MAYKVKQLAEMSGVSVRTLHHYDEVGLLKPAYVGANGYRFYEEEQLLQLQHILFYRELGLSLEEIQLVLEHETSDRIELLESHRSKLRRDLERRHHLLRTIDQTIEHLKGNKTMKNEDMFIGFDSPEQKKHEDYLVDRFGDEVKQEIARSRSRVKGWTQDQWRASKEEFAKICRKLVELMNESHEPSSGPVQETIRDHYQWICQYWTPDQESYAGYSKLVSDSELRNAYATHDERLPEFAAAAIRDFADSQLKPGL